MGRGRVKRTRERQFLGIYVEFIRYINDPWHGFRFDPFWCISLQLIRGHVFGEIGHVDAGHRGPAKDEIGRGAGRGGS